MRRAAFVLIATMALVAALSGAAWGDTVIIQQGHNGYISAADTVMEGHPNWDVRPMRWANLAAASICIPMATRTSAPARP